MTSLVQITVLVCFLMLLIFVFLFINTVEMVKRVEPAGLNPHNPHFLMGWINIFNPQKKIDPHNPRVEVERDEFGSQVNSFFFSSCFHFFYKIHSYIVNYSYTLWTILLIMNLYFVIDMINLWSVNFLMYF